VREQQEVLEHHADVARVGRQPRDVASADQDVAGIGRLEPGDHPQQRGLARTAGPEQREELVLVDSQLDTADRFGLAETLGDVADLQDGGHGRRCGGGRRRGARLPLDDQAASTSVQMRSHFSGEDGASN
jgi:hypothetical protein